jgi:hypothetical protein
MRLGSAAVLRCINAFDCSDSEFRLRSPPLALQIKDRHRTHTLCHELCSCDELIQVLEMAFFGNNLGTAAPRRPSALPLSGIVWTGRLKLTLLGLDTLTLRLLIGHYLFASPICAAHCTACVPCWVPRIPSLPDPILLLFLAPFHSFQARKNCFSMMNTTAKTCY